MESIANTKEWKELTAHHEMISHKHLRTLFESDPTRFDKFSIKFGDFLFDFSKNHINEDTLPLLIKLADKAGLKSKIEAMFAGEKINTTEKRAVLHTALRDFSGKPIVVDGADIMPVIKTVREQMKKFTGEIHSGKRKAANGEKFTDIVNIGIGGSDLGPAMVCHALKPYWRDGINMHFVSNVDATDIAETLKKIKIETTLFVIASKTFTTQETLANANTAKKYFLEKVSDKKEDIEKHFIALSTNEKACVEFGINPKNMFRFWDWVGGRYSLWSAIGLSISLAVGYENFEKLLQGAYEADCHFRETPLGRNIPVIMGLLGIWYSNFYGAKTHAVIPYDQYLKLFPDFLQQLDMESNGKTVTKSGNCVDYTTGPVVWGTIGTNSQHSFFQLIHQGSQMITADFIASANSHNDIGVHHDLLLANFFAQTSALMRGKTADEVKAELRQEKKSDEEIRELLPHKIFVGNKPTNTLLMKKLTPETLGALIALYEHKVFVMGAVWDINSFDQWGVELGKQLAKQILPELNNEDKTLSMDSSTNGLVNFVKNSR